MTTPGHLARRQEKIAARQIVADQLRQEIQQLQQQYSLHLGLTLSFMHMGLWRRLVWLICGAPRPRSGRSGVAAGGASAEPDRPTLRTPC